LRAFHDVFQPLGADPFIVATAVVLSGQVAAFLRLRYPMSARYKIPCITILDLLRAEGVKLK